jgi:hypothetical protein
MGMDSAKLFGARRFGPDFQHLCQQFHLTIRLKRSEAHPPNVKDIGFDSASVNAVLRTGLKLAGVTVVAQSLTPAERF